LRSGLGKLPQKYSVYLTFCPRYCSNSSAKAMVLPLGPARKQASFRMVDGVWLVRTGVPLSAADVEAACEQARLEREDRIARDI
jgi:hypothetical protein